MQTRKTLRGPGGLTLTLDTSEVHPDNPGDGTPAIVTLRGETSTYWAALDGYMDDGTQSEIQLTAQQVDWLEGLEEMVDQFLQAAEAAWDAKQGGQR